MQSSENPLEGFVFEQLEQPTYTAPALAAGAAAAAGGNPEHAELVDVREMARAEGFEEGRAQGMEAARVETAHAASALATALEEAQQRLEADAELLEWQAVELSLQLTEKIVGAALEVNPELVLDVIKGGLRRLVERDRVTVLVNPDDLELVRGAVDEVAASLGGIERLEAHGERRVGRGGAVLRTPVGEIDARVETQLARAREVVMRELVAPGIDESAES
jgi:flagellar assembly protein FliH